MLEKKVVLFGKEFPLVGVVGAAVALIAGGFVVLKK